MIAKITLTLEQDEQRGTNAAMEEAITLLSMIGGLPVQKVVVTMECAEMLAPQYRATLRSELRRRPIGIIAKTRTICEEQIDIDLHPPTTPMDDILDDDNVTLSHNGRSVTIGADSMAADMLRNTTELFEDE